MEIEEKLFIDKFQPMYFKDFEFDKQKLFNFVQDPINFEDVIQIGADLSEYVANTETNQIIREIRCSPIGSIPRSGDTNEWRAEGSLLENINNYGRINISGPSNNYNIIYNDYTIDGIVYTYSWNNNYI